PMAVQYITLEEAAKKLGIPTDEFKRRLKTEWTHLVPMRDGPTLRFRDTQIDELARQLGAASDPELPLAAMEESTEHGSDDFKVDAPAKSSKSGKSSKPSKVEKADEPLIFDASDDDIFSLSADAKSVQPSMSDSASDSDVRLEVGKAPKKKLDPSDPEAIPTEEISLDASSGPSSAIIKGGSSAKLSAPKSSGKLSAGTDSAKSLSSKHSTGDSSEFELSLDADSDDFELQLNTDSSDEVDLGSSPMEEAGGRAGKSGINLKTPGDSGVSLEKSKKPDSGKGLKKSDSDKGLKKPDSGKNLAKKPDSGKGLKKPAPKADDSDSDVDFELSLEPEPGMSSGKLGGKAGPRSGKIPITSDSDSEFELTLDDSSEGSSLEAAAMDSEESKGDIFETDFEIPPMTDESGSEAVALESDTDLEHTPSEDMALDESDVVAEEETGSQVVVLEDEPDASPRARKKGKQAEEDEGDVDLADVEEESASASAVLRGVKSRRQDEDEDEETTIPSGRAAPRPWGPLPAIILFPALLVVTLSGIMGYELLHTMTGYQQARKPAAPLVRGIAKAFDMELKDQ
ncbi:MAG TPA: hypothetical protein VGL71_05290, partial [Urbifossiella sp.]